MGVEAEFDLFVINVAIPSIQADLGASFAQIGFIVAGYERASGAQLITGGRLGDVFGRLWVWLWSASCYAGENAAVS
ncbi:hypothetical protein H4F33_08215 [Pectobacterium brasiliense]|uniref:Major facilitator superfamily (MFS) profile domain-containing protein n=1 Tax=Pectobacterium brasiliense TaxID=180957 RepID=A0AAE2WDW9_9GAMM|nr:MFS transporter [Pectobacterium brasiliense]MBA0219045.1 hypothetical protein [Pectobacterium brasiliense]MBN3051468.1 hypothetical protein [Pectobacterium brasiliense]MBN3072093.1 hypothetical protein [Pectobacterium brasiliense]MBN3170191.1 hypothetical protein [Pectobacterium brasiliense]